MMHGRRHMQLLLSIQNVQLSRQLAYGVVVWKAKLDKRLLLNGVRYKKEMVGKSIGQAYQQLPKAASNSQSVDVTPLATQTDSASATKSSFPAPNCALAFANNNVFS